MTAKTGSTYVSESMTDNVKILPAKLRFSTWASSKRMCLGDSSNNRQPKTAAETGNIYISGTVTDSVEIPTAIFELSPASTFSRRCII